MEIIFKDLRINNQKSTIQLEKNARLIDFIDALALENIRYCSFLINGHLAEQTTTLNDGDYVVITPLLNGG